MKTINCSICDEIIPNGDNMCGYCKTNFEKLEDVSNLFVYIIKTNKSEVN